MKKEISVPILEKILENIDEGLHYVDRECITQIYNQNMEKIEGMDRKLILGKNFRTIFKDIPEEDSTLLKALKGISTKNNVQRYLNKNGSQVYKAFTKDSSLLYDYIVANYSILHTQGKDYIIQDILHVANELGVKI